VVKGIRSVIPWRFGDEAGGLSGHRNKSSSTSDSSSESDSEVHYLPLRVMLRIRCEINDLRVHVVHPGRVHGWSEGRLVHLSTMLLLQCASHAPVYAPCFPRSSFDPCAAEPLAFLPSLALKHHEPLDFVGRRSWHEENSGLKVGSEESGGGFRERRSARVDGLEVCCG